MRRHHGDVLHINVGGLEAVRIHLSVQLHHGGRADSLVAGQILVVDFHIDLTGASLKRWRSWPILATSVPRSTTGWSSRWARASATVVTAWVAPGPVYWAKAPALSRLNVVAMSARVSRRFMVLSMQG